MLRAFRLKVSEELEDLRVFGVIKQLSGLGVEDGRALNRRP